MITLDQLLLSRDRRAQSQRSLLDTHPGLSLLCLTVQLPGAQKRSSLSLKIAETAVEAVRSTFSPQFERLQDLETGYEGYFLVEGDELDVKRRAVELEESHPLGRLWDLDVIEKEGEFVRPVSRTELGMGERSCLLCGRPARVCIRARSHTAGELLLKIEEMVKAYERD